jgi:hypothetical protein
VRYHRKSQTLEVRDFRTNVSDGTTRIQLCSASTFMKAELPTLLDKRLIAPKVKLDDCTISLTPRTPVPSPILTPATVAAGMVQPWKSRLDLLLTSIEWQKIREECQSLVAADDFAAELDDKMRRWLLRSQQILVHAGQLSQTVQSVNNPLRHANEIRQHLRLLEELAGEQVGLEKQFAAVDSLIAKKISELRSLGQQDAAGLIQKTERRSGEIEAEVANKAVTEWALCIATQHFEYAQATRMILPMPKQLSKPFDMNVRYLGKNASIVSLPMIQVNGKLRSPSNETIFQATGSYDQVQGLDYCLHGKADWTIDCSSRVTASVIHLTSGQQDPNWQIKSTALATSSSQPDASDNWQPDALARTSPPDASPIPLFSMQADLTDSDWSGIVKINIAGTSQLIRLPCSINADLAVDESLVGVTSSDAVWVEMELTGESGVTKLTLREPLSSDFVTRISAPIRAKIEAKRQVTEASLASELDNKCNRLSSHLKSSFAEGKQTLAKHRELLASVRSELKERIETDQNFEYARAYLRESISR